MRSRDILDLIEGKERYGNTEEAPPHLCSTYYGDQGLHDYQLEYSDGSDKSELPLSINNKLYIEGEERQPIMIWYKAVRDSLRVYEECEITISSHICPLYLP